MQPVLAIYALVSAFTSCADAWILDQSCVSPQGDLRSASPPALLHISCPDNLPDYADLITNGMKSAFDMSESARNLLQHIDANQQTSDETTLFHTLFQGAVGSDPSSSTLRRSVELRFDGVNSFKRTTDGAPSATLDNNLPISDVIVYCDYSRFKENQLCNGEEKKGTACDPTTNRQIDMDSMYTGCRDSVNFDTLEMWTLNNDMTTVPRPMPAAIAQIQACKWFLQFSFGQKRKYWRDIGPKAILAKPFFAFQKLFGDRTPMDAAAMIDHTLLHEMTHALKLSVNGVVPADDVQNAKNCYGWKNCVKLSPVKVSMDSGTLNADSLAFFGLGAKMISGGAGEPQRPLEDGQIRVIASNQARDALHVEDGFAMAAGNFTDLLDPRPGDSDPSISLLDVREAGDPPVVAKPAPSSAKPPAQGGTLPLPASDFPVPSSSQGPPPPLPPPPAPTVPSASSSDVAPLPLPPTPSADLSTPSAVPSPPPPPPPQPPPPSQSTEPPKSSTTGVPPPPPPPPGGSKPPGFNLIIPHIPDVFSGGGPKPSGPGPNDNDPKSTGGPKPTDHSNEDSSSCSKTQTASSCAITLSVFTPSGSSTASTSTITGTCSTTTGCSATNAEMTTTTISSQSFPTVTPIVHPAAWDGDTTWLQDQQDILESAASNTLPELTGTNTDQSSPASHPPIQAPAAAPIFLGTQRLTGTFTPLASALPSAPIPDGVQTGPVPSIVVSFSTSIVSAPKVSPPPPNVSPPPKAPPELLPSATTTAKSRTMDSFCLPGEPDVRFGC